MIAPRGALVSGQGTHSASVTGSDGANSRLQSENKPLKNAIARLALRGHAVHPCADGSFLVHKWGLSRYCPDIDALEEFCVTVGA